MQEHNIVSETQAQRDVCVWCCWLKAFNADDYIRWLSKLLQETSREPDSSTADADDIYDEVYNWAVYQSNG